MSQVRRPQHPNAALTPAHRLKMVRLVVEEGWSVPAVAQRFQVDDKTVRKWCDRYRAEGAAGLEDRSSRPRHSPNRTPEPLRRRVVELRHHTRRGAGFIAHATGMHASTVHRICVAEGLGRLDRGDRSTGPPTKPLRYERETPGEMVHVDVKKLPAIPDGGGWRTHRRGNAGPRQRARWRYVHSAIDDRTRLGYSEIHTNETGATAAGFWLRAAAFYALCGIACERVLTNNGPCYRSSDFANTLKDTRTSPVEGPDRHGCDSTPLLDGVSAVGRGPQTGPVRNSVSPLDSVSCRYRCDGCLCKTPTNPFYGNHTAQPLPADSGLRTSPGECPNLSH